jgi:hypothetical protein
MQDLSDAVLARLQRNPRQIANSEAFLDSLRKLFSVADGVGQQETFHEAYDAIEQVFMQLQIPGAGTPLVKNFEQWLSYLIETPPWLSPADQTRNRAAFLEVSRAVHDVLEERQRTTLMYQKDKCPDWLIRLVRRWHEDRASVITFNYDQLVELAWLFICEPHAATHKVLGPIPRAADTPYGPRRQCSPRLYRCRRFPALKAARLRGLVVLRPRWSTQVGAGTRFAHAQRRGHLGAQDGHRPPPLLFVGAE